MRIALCVVAVVCGYGCRGEQAAPPVRAGEPVGMQMVRAEGGLKGYPFRTILDFESASEAVFVRVEGPVNGGLDQAQAHTGEASLLVPAGSAGVTVRLSSLFDRREFPGKWTLLGAYVYSTAPQRVTAVYRVGTISRAAVNAEVPANQWTAVMVDVAAAVDESVKEVGTLRLGFGDVAASTAAVWVDDVVVMNNTRTLAEWRGPRGSSWSVKQQGFRYVLETPLRFKMTLKSVEATAIGWRLEEANALRACFSSTGPEKYRTVYYDGRHFLDGEYVPLGRDLARGVIAQQHRSPAQLDIPEEMGRLVRNTPGDRNNDGYSELTGAYQVQATGGRVQIGIIPRSGQVVRPVFEIAGLPAEGEVRVDMEGRLVERTARTADGKVLVELPGIIERVTLFSVSVGE